MVNFDIIFIYFVLVYLILTFFAQKSIPDWAEKVMINENFKSLALFWLEIQSYNNELKKIKPGYLLKSIFDRMRNKIQSTLKPDRKLFMYFAHDITIVSILNGLGLYKVNQF